jgi:hypothetical protein
MIDRDGIPLSFFDYAPILTTIAFAFVSGLIVKDKRAKRAVLSRPYRPSI